MTAPSILSTIEHAAARVRRDIGSRGLACVSETDVSVADDDGSMDVMIYYMIDGKWHATCVSRDAVPDGLDPDDVLDIVLHAAVEHRTLH